MKIAISANGLNLDAKVAERLSTAEYLIIIDIDSGAFEALPNPVNARQSGAGVQVIMLAMNKGARAVLTGYCKPSIASRLKSNGIEVLTDITGTVRNAVERYKKVSHVQASETGSGFKAAIFNKYALFDATKKSARQFVALLPVLAGVILLIGLLSPFVTKELLTNIFPGNVALDTIWGAIFGSIFAGNSINSYVIGGELMRNSVSLFAVTALIVTWVTVGLVQLPAEIAAFGKRFALLRNGLSFIMAIPIAILTVFIINLIAGWIS